MVFVYRYFILNMRYQLFIPKEKCSKIIATKNFSAKIIIAYSLKKTRIRYIVWNKNIVVEQILNMWIQVLNWHIQLIASVCAKNIHSILAHIVHFCMHTSLQLWDHIFHKTTNQCWISSTWMKSWTNSIIVVLS